jgi:hypothetical protein
MKEISSQIAPGKSPLLQPPNYQRDIDAPRLVATDLSGIVLHGDAAGLAIVRLFFERCFFTRLTSKVPEGLADFYKVRSVVWVEIGKGLPWQHPTLCAE